MSNYEFWIELGNIYKAINAYQEKAIEFNKRFIFPWIRLGNIFDKQSRSEDAIKAYQKAIELDPQNSTVWNEIGNVHLKAGDFTQAETAYRKAMEYDPASGWPYSNLALSYFRQARYAEAIPLFQKSIGLFLDEKSKAISWNRLGNTYQRLDDKANAIAAYQNADNLDPDSSALRNNLGEGMEMDEPGSLSEGTINETLESDSPVVNSPVVDQTTNNTGGEVPVDTGAGAGDVSGITSQIDPLAIEAPEKIETVVVQDASSEPVQEAALTNEPQPEKFDSEVSEEPVPTTDPVAEATMPPETFKDSADVVIQSEPPATLDLPLEESTATGVQPGAQDDMHVLVEASAVPQPATETIIAGDSAREQPTLEEAQKPGDLPNTVTEEVVVPEVKEEQIVAAPVKESETSVEASTEGDPAAAVAVNNEQPAIVPAEEPAVQAKESVSAGGIAEGHPDEPASAVASEESGTVLGETLAMETDTATVVDPEPEAQKVSPLAIVNAIIDADVKSAHVWNELGNIYISIGAYEQAIDVYHKAIELDPEFGWPYSNLALTYFSQGKYAEAIPLYQKSIELLGGNKEKATSWNRLGNAYRSMNNIENAAKAYTNAATLDPDNKSFMNNAAEYTPDPNPTSIKEEKQATDEVPLPLNDSAAFQEESVSQIETTAAVIETAQAAETEPAPVPVETVQASPAAEDKAEEALSLEAVPAEMKAESSAGDGVVVDEPEVKLLAEELEKSNEAPKELVETGDNPQVITILEEKPEEIISLPESPSAQSIGDIVVPENVKTESIVEVDTKSAHIWNDLGRTYFNKGNFDDAIYAYKKAIDFDPEFGRPYSNLAAIYLRQGLYAEAIPLYQRSVELLESDNEKAASWNKLGNAYRRLGDYDKAIAAYHMADELDPVNSRAPLQSPFNAMRTNFVQHGTPAVG